MTILYLVSLLITLNLVYSEQNYSRIIRIGGLFHSSNPELERIFISAITDANIRRLLPDHRVVPIYELVPENDPFQVGLAACRLLQNNVSAIFGPQKPSPASHVQSVCDVKDIPHIETRLDTFQRRGSCSLNLYPYPSTLAKALLAVIKAWNWKTFTILYEKDSTLRMMGEILEMPEGRANPVYNVIVRQLPEDKNYREVLRSIQKSASFRIVLECSVDILEEVLIQAQQVGIIVAEYSYIIANLDVQTVNMEAFKYAGANITGFRMVNPDLLPNSFLKDKPILLETALLYDAVHMFIRYYDVNFTAMPLDCNDEMSWGHGYTLINYMRSMEYKGVTGSIKFDYEGFRSDFDLDIMEATENGWENVGTWNASYGLNIKRTPVMQTINSNEISVANQSFIVLIAISPPYGFVKENINQLTGNDRYEGFAIDLIQEMAHMLGFSYTFQVQEDNVYGSYNKEKKEWDGMLRRIIDGTADLAITDLTITRERESAVDFTMPFMNLGITILYKKPGKAAASLFSFMDPFSMEVWMYVLAAYIGVSVLLFIMARISPYEWTNPYPCIEEPEVLENQFSLKNSLWFTIGSLMQQGSEIAPMLVLKLPIEPDSTE